MESGCNRSPESRTVKHVVVGQKAAKLAFWVSHPLDGAECNKLRLRVWRTEIQKIPKITKITRCP